MKLIEFKEYGGLGFLIVSALVAAAVSYGSSQATASINFSNYNDRFSNQDHRLDKLEKDNEDNGKMIARIDQKIEDIWEKVVTNK